MKLTKQQQRIRPRGTIVALSARLWAASASSIANVFSWTIIAGNRFDVLLLSVPIVPDQASAPWVSRATIFDRASFKTGSKLPRRAHRRHEPASFRRSDDRIQLCQLARDDVLALVDLPAVRT